MNATIRLEFELGSSVSLSALITLTLATSYFYMTYAKRNFFLSSAKPNALCAKASTLNNFSNSFVC